MTLLKMIITVIIMLLATLLGMASKPAGAGQIGGVKQFLNNVTDVLHKIEDNVRPPFPTKWLQCTLVLALVWMFAPFLVNLWDAMVREAEGTSLQGIDKFINRFRDQHMTVRHQTMLQAIAGLESVFTAETIAQARRERDYAIANYEAIKAAKSLVAAELEGAIIKRDDAVASRKAIEADKSLVVAELEAKAFSLQKAEADLEKARAELSRLREAAGDQVRRAQQEMLERLDDIEDRTKKLEEDAVTMAKKQAVSTSGKNDG
ncbi:hypothetical protein B0T25DRAFT_515029 [Lasiosphaeria hispida]|uniref:Uncharacterized protein n=1 Tax=Lasiosphaeria hispida TaxID=260671 RepID=A0AAJ0HQI2_9PEZI|nr:hypothetical protein B0T25DRAFT_515029 [Lasiosphaeria hispida]